MTKLIHIIEWVSYFSNISKAPYKQSAAKIGASNGEEVFNMWDRFVVIGAIAAIVMLVKSARNHS